MNSQNLCRRPLRLVPNRFYRTYVGGREIDKFRGIEETQDSHWPEGWIGSTTKSALLPPGVIDTNYGLAEVLTEQNTKVYLKELIDNYPEGFLGHEHVNKFGSNMGVLLKLLDAQRKLTLQCHPSREYAKEHFNSEYGKIESWHVIGVREDTAEPPFVYLGFKEGITREYFQDLFEKEDITGLENCCHKIPVSVGDIYFVDSGVPHAIGPGCFIIEAQEPSDVGAYCNFPPMDERMKRKHIEKCIGCFDYRGSNYKDNLKKYKVLPEVAFQSDCGIETILIGPKQTNYFSLTQLEVLGAYHETNKAFYVALILEGSGRLVADGHELEIKKGDELFIPAGVNNCIWINESSNLKVIKAFSEI